MASTATNTNLQAIKDAIARLDQYAKASEENLARHRSFGQRSMASTTTTTVDYSIADLERRLLALEQALGHGGTTITVVQARLDPNAADNLAAETQQATITTDKSFVSTTRKESLSSAPPEIIMEMSASGNQITPNLFSTDAYKVSSDMINAGRDFLKSKLEEPQSSKTTEINTTLAGTLLPALEVQLYLDPPAQVQPPVDTSSASTPATLAQEAPQTQPQQPA
jgi:hypothetical protein